jgi:hypothetical protein
VSCTQTALIREATLMRKLNHPNVLALRAAFVAEKELWFVEPFMVRLASTRCMEPYQGCACKCSSATLAAHTAAPGTARTFLRCRTWALCAA